MVAETNRYPQQSLENANISRFSRLRKWKETSAEEMEKFLGIIFWKGLNKKPKLSDCWKKNPLIDLLLERFQSAIIPARDLCIDETMVPFQYIKNKKHKFGIKLYKLCTNNGYTYNLKVYCGRDAQPGVPVASSVVMELSKNLLDSGRVLYIDNFYTSMHLAHELLKRGTHLVGTLRKFNRQDVIKAKLKVSETVARESNTGAVVLKGKDKLDVLKLSTLHDDTMSDVESENDKVLQPKMIIDYNSSKGFIDITDQMKAYSCALRRGIKWYRKLAM
nr:unnamed protein product [Callosobruchus chinensis]